MDLSGGLEHGTSIDECLDECRNPFGTLRLVLADAVQGFLKCPCRLLDLRAESRPLFLKDVADGRPAFLEIALF